MLILGITTSAPVCGIALMRDGEIIGETSFPGARACVEALVPGIEKLLTEHGYAPSAPDIFALDAGPGGLTGVKIGLVTVRTLAQAAAKPVAPVSSLLAVAFQSPPGETLIMAAADCSATEVFSGIYMRENEGAIPACVSTDRLDTPETAAERLVEFNTKGNICLTGAASGRVLEKLQEISPGMTPRITADGGHLPLASSFCALALHVPHVEWRALQATYLSITQAERIPHAERAGVKGGISA